MPLGHKYTEADVSVALSEIENATELQVTFLTDWYNNNFELNHDASYYRRIFGPFLLTYLPTLYDHWKHPKPETSRPPETGFIPLEPCDFIHLARFCDGFHWQICQDLLSLASLCKVDRRTVFYSPRNPLTRWERCLSHIEFLPTKLFPPVIAHFLTPMVRADRLALAWKTRFKFGPVAGFESPTNVLIDQRLRQRIFEAAVNHTAKDSSPFAVLAFRLLAAYLPVSITEDFSAAQGQMRRRAEANRPRSILTGFGFLANARFTIWASECAARNTELIGWQHGGTYGEAAPSNFERFERCTTDKFITWGWNDGHGKIEELPCPRQSIARRKASNRDATDRILWVTTSDSRHVYTVHHLRFGRRFEDYFDHQRRVVGSLPKEIRTRIHVRRYRNDFGHLGENHWESSDTSPTIASRKDTLVSQAISSELTIIDHFGATSFLECLLADIPTIIVGPSDYFKPRKSAQPAFNALVDAGIAHTSVSSARDFIVSNDKRFHQWWRADKTRMGRAFFMKNFCRVAPDYRCQWVKGLEK